MVTGHLQLILAPAVRVLLRPVPVVDVGGVGSLLHDPARVALSPLGHRLKTNRIKLKFSN